MIKTRRVLSLPINRIKYLENVRKEFNATEMAELMVSMKQIGLLQPIGVKEDGSNHCCIYGYRRLQAATKLGWKTIDAVLVDSRNEEDDIIKNSSENIHRANVSLPEQGRVFSALLKRGLTAKEISARVGCTSHFVRQALDAYMNVPRRYRDKITHGTRGKVDKEGTLSATSALRISALKRGHNLKEDDAEKLYQMAMKDKINAQQVSNAANLIATGTPVDKAIEKATTTRVITLSVFMDAAKVKAWEKREKKSIHDYLYTLLKKHSGIEVMPGRAGRKGATVTALTQEEMKI
jgi:ParB/RepB/Spo0J family partition protein